MSKQASSIITYSIILGTFKLSMFDDEDSSRLEI